MGCIEQKAINREVRGDVDVPLEEIDAVKNPQYIRQYHLKVTPTTVILVDDVEKKRFEGLVHREELVGEIRKYL